MTGGAGYIGSHAAKALRGAGYRVVLFDNLRAGHRAAALGATLIEGELQDSAAVRAAIPAAWGHRRDAFCRIGGGRRLGLGPK